MQVLEARKILVRDGRLDIELAVLLSAFTVDEGTAQRILGLLPNLARHVCVNGRADGTFGDEIVGTESAHLLEHCIIELQGKATGASGLMGHTSWAAELSDTRDAGIALMRVTVSFANDLVALQALRESLALVQWALAPESFPRPDVSAALARVACMINTTPNC
jgi:hypothetical protein